MIVGVPKEVKRDEYRVGMLPVGVEELVRRGHRVLIEAGAGLGSGLADHAYLEQGAELVTADEVFAQADLIVKGERILHQLAKFNYNADKLRETIELMRTLNYRLGEYRYTDLIGAHKQLVEDLKTSRELYRHEYRTRREEEAAVPPKVRRLLTDSMDSDFPELYGELLKEYYKAISQ